MVKLLLADNFYPENDATKLYHVVNNLPFERSEYGEEIRNFNLIFPDLEPVFTRVLGEEVFIDEDRSGVFRKPLHCQVHFESFDCLDEWCFIIALQPTTFNLWHHLKEPLHATSGMPEIDARSALDGYNFNYTNFFEWNIDVNIQLEANQGVFFRPWMFHSLEHGVVQYFRLINKKHQKQQDSQ